MNANYISLKCLWIGAWMLINTSVQHIHQKKNSDPAISATLATASSHSPEIEMKIKKVWIFMSVICRNPVESEHSSYVLLYRCGTFENQCSKAIERRYSELTDHKSIYFSQVVQILINSLSTLGSIRMCLHTYYTYMTRQKQHSIWVMSYAVVDVIYCECKRKLWMKTIRKHKHTRSKFYHLHTLNICLQVSFIELYCHYRWLVRN